MYRLRMGRHEQVGVDVADHDELVVDEPADEVAAVVGALQGHGDPGHHLVGSGSAPRRGGLVEGVQVDGHQAHRLGSPPPLRPLAQLVLETSPVEHPRDRVQPGLLEHRPLPAPHPSEDQRGHHTGHHDRRRSRHHLVRVAGHVDVAQRQEDPAAAQAPDGDQGGVGGAAQVGRQHDHGLQQPEPHDGRPRIHQEGREERGRQRRRRQDDGRPPRVGPPRPSERHRQLCRVEGRHQSEAQRHTEVGEAGGGGQVHRAHEEPARGSARQQQGRLAQAEPGRQPHRRGSRGRCHRQVVLRGVVCPSRLVPGADADGASGRRSP